LINAFVPWRATTPPPQISTVCPLWWRSGKRRKQRFLQQRIKAHQSNWNTILASIIGHHNISHPRAVIDLAHWLVDNTGSLYSVSRLTDYLKSLGHRVRKSSVVDWLAVFEDAGLLFSVNILSSSPTRISVNARKVYCIDHPLVTSVSSDILTNRNSLLENLVFTALHRVTPKIRVAARNNSTIWRRILVRHQGTSVGASRDMCRRV
jgi:predicted AAA+ superfamily ATPase